MRRAALLAVVGLAGCGGGEKLQAGDLPQAPATIRVTSPAFRDGATIPRRFTCSGAGAQPALRYAGVPRAARELVLVVSDPDAPGGTFVHLTRFGMAAHPSGTVPTQGSEGKNSAGDSGWTAPCPPKGDDPHRYVFALYALRTRSGLEAGAEPGDVTKALDGKVAARGTVTGRFGR